MAISPHLDDVALGCADLVGAHPGALVVTVTAGRPGPHELTDWDRACGFGQDEDVVGARRREDDAALAHLGATARWLDFLDRQYADGHAPEPAGVANAIRGVVRDARMVASPLGMLHPDHVAVAAACFEVARQIPSRPWILYEDAIYRRTKGATDSTISRLKDEGWSLEEIAVPEDPRKRAAVDSYTSQVIGLGALLLDAFRPERYWSLVRST